MVLKAYRYRFYPTEEQKLFLSKTFGCCRFVYNHFLKAKQEMWKEKNESLSYADCCKLLTDLKKERVWLKEVSSVCLQQSVRHLLNSFKLFFQKHTRFPKIKKKHGAQSASFMRNAFSYEKGEVRVAKLGKIQVRWSRIFSGFPISITLSKDGAERYFISFLTEEEPAILNFSKKAIGLDVGLSSVITDHKGNKMCNPRFLEAEHKKLRRAQKKLPRKVRHSHNRSKARTQLARFHGRIRDKRLDFLHKLSRQLVNENQVIAVETLDVKKMQKNKYLSRRIGDVGWSTLFRFLEYKCQWYKREYVQIGSYFPSSKQCFFCQNRVKELSLETRRWSCPTCHQEHDRDTNAARNILAEGLKLIGKRLVPRGSRDLKPVEQV